MKQIFTKSLFLLAILLIGGGNLTWAYDIPEGQVISNVFLGTLNEDKKSVSVETFENATALGSKWNKNNVNSISIGTLTEVPLPEVGSAPTGTPTYVANKTFMSHLRQGTQKENAQPWYVTYNLGTTVSKGTLVFNGDFASTHKNDTYFRFIDDEDNPVLLLLNYRSSNSQQPFRYQVGTGAVVSTETNTAWQSYPNFRIEELIINLDEGTASFTIDYIARRSSAWKREKVTVSNINIGKGKKIKAFQIGRYSVSSTDVDTYLDNVSLYSVEPTYDYTINYVDGEEIVKSESGTELEGYVANTLYKFTENDVKYIRNAEAPASVTIDKDHKTFDISVHEAQPFTYKVYAVNATDQILETIYEASHSIDETFKVYYPNFVRVDNQLYSAPTTDNEYSKSFTLEMENQVDKITYSDASISNVVFLTEGEDITGAEIVNDGSINARCSKGAGGVVNNVELVSLPAGVYKMTVYFMHANKQSHQVSVTDGTSPIFEDFSFESGRKSQTREFELTKETTLYITGGNKNGGRAIDLVYIQKTGDVYTKTTGDTGFITFSATVPVTVPEGLTVYKSEINGDVLTVTPSDCTIIPKNTGVIVKGEANTTYAFVQAAEEGEEITTALTAAPDGITSDGTIYGLLKAEKTFAKVKSGTSLAANSAYLQLSAGAPAIRFVIGTPTAVGGVVEAQKQQIAVKKYFNNGQLIIETANGKVNAAGMQMK